MTIPHTHRLKGSTTLAGAFITKEASADDKMKNDGIAKLTTELTEAVGHMAKFRQDHTETAKALAELKATVATNGAADAETKAKIGELAKANADAMAKFQSCEAAIDTLKKQLDSPLFAGTQKDMVDNDRKAAVELQRRAHLFKGQPEETFTPDMTNLVNAADYRSAAVKMVMMGGLESRATIASKLTAGEQKAFEAAGMDAAFFMPEMLGMEVDCEIECAEMLDLYDSVNVSRSTFRYPHVTSYGDMGSYQCPAKCDAELGPVGNIDWRNGSTYDFRGAFCFNRDVLREANYDLLGFMLRSAARSYRINRNRALITGDGVNEPEGWLTADVFTKIETPNPNPSHVNLRQFLASAPMEYGAVTATMHQNTFAYFAAMTDNDGRFLFGDGMMSYSPADVRERIRISNCLPDPTADGTLGDAANPFVAGSFIMAAGVWKKAYAAVNHRAMFMEQFIGGSTAWCAMYQFGAKDGGFVACAPAARILVAGS